MYDYLLDAIGAFWRYGASPTALVVALIALFKTKHFKRFIGKRAPWLFKDDADVLNYQSRQIRIENKLDALMSAGGVTWDAHCLNGKQLQNVTDGQKNNLLKSLMELFRALTIGALTRTKKDSYHLKIREGNIQMKNYLKKLGSRKFQAFLSVSIPNLIIMFGFIFGGIDIEGEVNQWMPAINLVIQALVTAVYQKTESNVDVASAKSASSVTVTDIEKSYHGE